MIFIAFETEEKNSIALSRIYQLHSVKTLTWQQHCRAKEREKKLEMNNLNIK